MRCKFSHLKVRLAPVSASRPRQVSTGVRLRAPGVSSRLGDVVLDLFDSHCHLDDEAFAADRQAVLDRLRAFGFASLTEDAELAVRDKRIASASVFTRIVVADLDVADSFPGREGRGSLHFRGSRSLAGGGLHQCRRLPHDVSLPQADFH